MMDAKALAKSKRAHSQYHAKKRHPNTAAKTSSAGTAGETSSKKPLAKQVGEESSQSHSSTTLPSNWDRYKDRDDSGSDDLIKDSITQATDVVMPKSKGADYAFLISEAKSQSQSQNYSSDIFPSFDDVLNELCQGSYSLHSVRGQSLLSWVAEDNFVVEDKATASHEVSFLSLNLNDLAEQLAKVDLSQRLFMEADLLPPELCAELQANSKPESAQSTLVSVSRAAKKDPAALASSELPLSDTAATTITSKNSHPLLTSTPKGSSFMNQVTHEIQQADRPGQRFDAITKPKTESRFEAASVEAELDMLLDSFSETKILDSPKSREKSRYGSYVAPEGNSRVQQVSSVPSGTAQQWEKDPVSSKSAIIAANFDDAIDDLLNETSNLINQNASNPHKLQSAPIDIQPLTSSAPVSKSKLLDDFDSWLDTI